MKKSLGYVVIVIFLAILVGLGYFSYDVITDTGIIGQGSTENTQEEDSEEDANPIKLGLDLSGGVSITYQIVDENPSKDDIEDTIAKLEQRAESYSTEYAVYQAGDDRITVEIPGTYNANEVLEELGSPGSLFFITEHDAEGNANYTYDTNTGEYVLTADILDLIANGSVILDGSDVKSAKAGYQNSNGMEDGDPVVELSFYDEAAQDFEKATTAAVESGDSIGIYYDDHFISVPTVSSVISDGQCIIQGMESYESASELATFIRVGAINLELEELESNVVGAQLGGKALSSSVKAALIGLILIMLFMIIMYRVMGAVAAIALGIYTTLVVSLIQLFEITLTLPGIAGVILGIGMAVDANVIIFARIREEISGGMSVRNAIEAGYKKASSAILDGNITTFIAAIVLILLGSGTVKGFAYTLIISIVVSMFTALFVSRFLMKSVYAVGLRNKKLYGELKEKKQIDFLKYKTIFASISVVIIAAGIIGMIVFGITTKRALNFSLEFMGGSSTTADFGKEYTIEEIEDEIVPSVEKITGDGNIQATTVDGTTDIVLKTRTLTLDERQELADLLVEEFGVDESTIENQSISSTISSEMKKDAIGAVIVACICMLIYIWIRFKDLRFATSSIIALLHDVLIVLAAYALIRISAGGTLIACMLTIVGYSINDTIVIFDRIRENMKGIKVQTPDDLKEIVNKSLTQTLSRTINTSVTTFIMVLLLYILGVTSIREFALPLMVGIIAGTYSSVFIATQLWYVMKLRFGKDKLISKQ